MAEKMPSWHVFFLFIPIWMMYYLGNFGAFSRGKDLTLYLMGYYILSHDVIMERLEKSNR